MKALWILVYVLNGHVMQSEPMGGEGCLLTAMYKQDNGVKGVYCLNTSDGTKVFPVACPNSVGQYYCK